MQPRYTEDVVENLSGEQNVSDLHSAFYDDYISVQDMKRNIPDWLQEKNPEDYETRLHNATYHAHVQGEMAAWLSTLDADTVEAEDVIAKYKELKRDFRSDHQHIQLSNW